MNNLYSTSSSSTSSTNSVNPHQMPGESLPPDSTSSINIKLVAEEAMRGVINALDRANLTFMVRNYTKVGAFQIKFHNITDATKAHFDGLLITYKADSQCYKIGYMKNGDLLPRFKSRETNLIQWENFEHMPNRLVPVVVNLANLANRCTNYHLLH
jgi:hypothetical protein